METEFPGKAPPYQATSEGPKKKAGNFNKKKLESETIRLYN